MCPMFTERQFQILSNREREDRGFLKDHAHRAAKMEDIGGGCQDIRVMNMKLAGYLASRDEIG